MKKYIVVTKGHSGKYYRYFIETDNNVFDDNGKIDSNFDKIFLSNIQKKENGNEFSPYYSNMSNEDIVLVSEILENYIQI